MTEQHLPLTDFIEYPPEQMLARAQQHLAWIRRRLIQSASFPTDQLHKR